MTVVRNFVVDNFLFGDVEKLKEETSFLREGIIDSTGILELINFLECTFEITIEDGEVIPENLDSVNNVCNFLTLKLNHN